MFQIDPMVTASLSGLTITGGSTAGCRRWSVQRGTATLSDCTISGNSAGYGGGLFSDGTLTLDHCTISGNSAIRRGRRRVDRRHGDDHRLHDQRTTPPATSAAA